jgi:hypothetical protein
MSIHGRSHDYGVHLMKQMEMANVIMFPTIPEIIPQLVSEIIMLPCRKTAQWDGILEVIYQTEKKTQSRLTQEPTFVKFLNLRNRETFSKDVPKRFSVSVRGGR